MAAQTGSNFIYGTMIDIVEIATANLGSELPTVISSTNVLINDCYNDGQPEIAIWPLEL